MKYLVALVVAAFVAVASTVCAQQPLPFYEPFDASYTNGGTVGYGGLAGSRLDLGTPASIWTLGSSGGGGSMSNSGPAALTYPSLAVSSTPSVGLYFPAVSPSGRRTRGVVLPGVSNGPVYMSFLLNITAPPAGTRALFMLVQTNSGIPTPSLAAAVWVNTTTNLGVSKLNSTTPTATTASSLTPGTHLVVMRYTFNTATTTDDTVDLWVDPASSSFGAGEGSVPTPDVSTATGNDLAYIQSVYAMQLNNTTYSTEMLMDELRVATNWAQVTPTGISCSPASFSSSPANATIAAGLNAVLSASPAGSSPALQWQLSTDNGVSWSNIAGATNGTYNTANLFTNSSGYKYRALCNVSCGGGSSATSGVATVTVTNPVYSAAGIVVDDFWADGDRTNTPVATNNSVWYASAASLTASVGSMTGTPAAGNSRLWIGYFADTNAASQPVSLAVGSTLKVKAVFTLSGFTAFTGGANSVRIGLFDYTDGGTRVGDNFGTGSSGNGQGVRGYMAILNWGTTFTSDTLIDLYARTSPGDVNLMGTTGGIYTRLGTGPGGTHTGTNAFAAGPTYTLEMDVARTGTNSTTITTTISGGSLNYSYSTNDTTSAFYRFDSFGLRPNTLESTADSFVFTEFKAEVVSGPASPGTINVGTSGSNVVLTWTNAAAALQVSSTVNSGFSTLSGATSPFTTNTTNTKLFFRLVQ